MVRSKSFQTAWPGVLINRYLIVNYISMNFFERGLRCLGKLNPLRLDPNRSYRGGAEQLENLLDISRINPLNSRNGGNNPVVHTFEELAGQDVTDLIYLNTLILFQKNSYLYNLLSDIYLLILQAMPSEMTSISPCWSVLAICDLTDSICARASLVGWLQGFLPTEMTVSSGFNFSKNSQVMPVLDPWCGNLSISMSGKWAVATISGCILLSPSPVSKVSNRP